MTLERRLEIMDAAYAEIRALAAAKSADYAPGIDTLANFKSGAKTCRLTPFQYLFALVTKQWDAISTAIDANPAYPKTSFESLKDKMRDVIAYTLLLECLLEELKPEDPKTQGGDLKMNVTIHKPVPAALMHEALLKFRQGGPVECRKPYIVGDTGPEIIVPSTERMKPIPFSGLGARRFLTETLPVYESEMNRARPGKSPIHVCYVDDPDGYIAGADKYIHGGPARPKFIRTVAFDWTHDPRFRDIITRIVPTVQPENLTTEEIDAVRKIAASHSSIRGRRYRRENGGVEEIAPDVYQASAPDPDRPALTVLVGGKGENVALVPGEEYVRAIDGSPVKHLGRRDFGGVELHEFRDLTDDGLFYRHVDDVRDIRHRPNAA